MPGVLFLLLALLAASPILAAEGVVQVKSAHPVQETADRLVSALEAKGMRVFLRVDHAAGAKQTGGTLRPTELLIFGNPEVGTPLMSCRQTIGLDLPQKALVWQDQQGAVWLSYNEPAYLARRHDLQGCEAVLEKVAAALSGFARAATAP